MKKRASEKRYGFEGDSDYIAKILGFRLREFVPRDEIKELVNKVYATTKLEFHLMGKKPPKKEDVQARAQEYLEALVPQIYEYVLNDIKTKNPTYILDEDGTPLEVFEANKDHLYHLTGIAELFEKMIREKYKHE